jgi:hypothetical protein
MEGGRSAPRPGRFTSPERPGTHCIGGWVGPHTHSSFGSTNTFCRQKLDYRALSLFGGIHGKIVNCCLASVSVSNTLSLSGVYQISPDIHCHITEKSQSSTAGNYGAPTSVPLSLGHSLYMLNLSSPQINCTCDQPNK